MTQAKALQQDPHFFEAPASADLSLKTNYFVVLTAGQVAVASAGVKVAGVLDNNPNAADKPATVQYGGVAVVLSGSSGSAGAVSADSAGKAIPTTGTAETVGLALHDYGSGENVAVLLTPSAAIAGGGALEIKTTGALSVVKRTSLLATTGTTAYTLASGLYAGQRKTIQETLAATIPAGTITGVFLDTDGTTARTTAAFNAVADQLELEWTGAVWQVLLKTSVTMG